LSLINCCVFGSCLTNLFSNCFYCNLTDVTWCKYHVLQILHVAHVTSGNSSAHCTKYHIIIIIIIIKRTVLFILLNFVTVKILHLVVSTRERRVCFVWILIFNFFTLFGPVDMSSYASVYFIWTVLFSNALTLSHLHIFHSCTECFICKYKYIYIYNICIIYIYMYRDISYYLYTRCDVYF